MSTDLFNPEPIWKGKSVFLIGGGSSLKGFDFSVLKGCKVIGINDAFKLGPEIVSCCLFGDASFFHKNVVELDKFKSMIVTCSPNLIGLRVSWMKRMKREKDGFYGGDTLGWNYSTGAAAINLAYLFGAARIYLLGYDGGRLNGATHWHQYRSKPIADESYARFLKGFVNLEAAMRDLKDVQVYNVTNGESLLPVFTRINFKTFGIRLKNERN